MARSIPQAMIEEATRCFFHSTAAEPPSGPPEGTRMTQAEWDSLSPGYRCEIAREMAPRPTPEGGDRRHGTRLILFSTGQTGKNRAIFFSGGGPSRPGWRQPR